MHTHRVGRQRPDASFSSPMNITCIIGRYPANSCSVERRLCALLFFITSFETRQVGKSATGPCIAVQASVAPPAGRTLTYFPNYNCTDRAVWSRRRVVHALRKFAGPPSCCCEHAPILQNSANQNCLLSQRRKRKHKHCCKQIYSFPPHFRIFGRQKALLPFMRKSTAALRPQAMHRP